MKGRQRLSPWVSILLILFSFSALPLLSSSSSAASRNDQLVDALVANLTHPSQHIRIEAVSGTRFIPRRKCILHRHRPSSPIPYLPSTQE